MGAFGVALLPDWVGSLLSPAEVALSWELVTVLSGVHSADGHKPRPNLSLDIDALNPLNPGAGQTTGLLSIHPDYFDHRFSGTASTGQAGSIGAQLGPTLSTCSEILLTTERIVLADSGKKEFLASIPRQLATGFSITPTLTKRGRATLTFVDGSTISPIFGVVSQRAVRRFERAWLTGTPQS